MKITKNERGLLLVMMEPEPEFDGALNRWYEEEHFGERLNVPGFINGRRFQSVEGGPKYLALYDIDNVDVLDTPEYRAIQEPPSPWTQVVREHVKISRYIYRDITPTNISETLPVRRPAHELWPPA
jgi:hypothetical protein